MEHIRYVLTLATLDFFQFHPDLLKRCSNSGRFRQARCRPTWAGTPRSFAWLTWRQARLGLKSPSGRTGSKPDWRLFSSLDWVPSLLLAPESSWAGTRSDQFRGPRILPTPCSCPSATHAIPTNSTQQQKKQEILPPFTAQFYFKKLVDSHILNIKSTLKKRLPALKMTPHRRRNHAQNKSGHRNCILHLPAIWRHPKASLWE